MARIILRNTELDIFSAFRNTVSTEVRLCVNATKVEDVKQSPETITEEVVKTFAAKILAIGNGNVNVSELIAKLHVAADEELIHAAEAGEGKIYALSADYGQLLNAILIAASTSEGVAVIEGINQVGATEIVVRSEKGDRWSRVRLTGAVTTDGGLPNKRVAFQPELTLMVKREDFVRQYRAVGSFDSKKACLAVTRDGIMICSADKKAGIGKLNAVIKAVSEELSSHFGKDGKYIKVTDETTLGYLIPSNVINLMSSTIMSGDMIEIKINKQMLKARTSVAEFTASLVAGDGTSYFELLSRLVRTNTRYNICFHAEQALLAAVLKLAEQQCAGASAFADGERLVAYLQFDGPKVSVKVPFDGGSVELPIVGNVSVRDMELPEGSRLYVDPAYLSSCVAACDDKYVNVTIRTKTDDGRAVKNFMVMPCNIVKQGDQVRWAHGNTFALCPGVVDNFEEAIRNKLAAKRGETADASPETNK